MCCCNLCHNLLAKKLFCGSLSRYNKGILLAYNVTFHLSRYVKYANSFLCKNRPFYFKSLSFLYKKQSHLSQNHCIFITFKFLDKLVSDQITANSSLPEETIKVLYSKHNWYSHFYYLRKCIITTFFEA